MKTKYAVYVPHTAGRYQKRRFRKALCPIVERWEQQPSCRLWALLWRRRHVGRLPQVAVGRSCSIYICAVIA